jgi:hypothetical protein
MTRLSRCIRAAQTDRPSLPVRLLQLRIHQACASSSLVQSLQLRRRGVRLHRRRLRGRGLYTVGFVLRCVSKSVSDGQAKSSYTDAILNLALEVGTVRKRDCNLFHNRDGKLNSMGKKGAPAIAGCLSLIWRNYRVVLTIGLRRAWILPKALQACFGGKPTTQRYEVLFR